MKYVVYDTAAKPSSHGFGFVNTRTVVAFENVYLANIFVDSRFEFDYSCRIITCAEARRLFPEDFKYRKNCLRSVSDVLEFIHDPSFYFNETF